MMSLTDCREQKKREAKGGSCFMFKLMVVLTNVQKCLEKAYLLSFFSFLIHRIF